MNFQKIVVFLRRIIFLAVVVAILIHVSAVFERKTIYNDANYSIKIGGFGLEPENSFDVMGFGSSHMYCTLNPVYLYEQTGIRSYVFATQQQPVVATYYYIKEALKTQHPDVLIVEALMFAADRGDIAEGVAHDAIDPFPNSMDKLRMILEMDQEDAKEHYFLNFMKYHSRWKDLKEYDFTFEHLDDTDPYHGYVFLSKITENNLTALSYDDVTAADLREENMRVLLDIHRLAEENDIQLLLLFAPCQINNLVKGEFKSLHAFAEENAIDTLDLNVLLDELSLDNASDYYDPGHLNVYGSEKVTMYIADYIARNYILTEKFVDDAELWEADIKVYNARKAKLGK